MLQVDIMLGGTRVELQRLECEFTICKIDDVSQIDFTREFVFLSKTNDEVSLVCESTHVPPVVLASETGWSALKVSGILDFGMVGVIAKIARALAEIGVSIFVVSTYNTDYVLVKTEQLEQSLQALTCNGYIIK